MFLGVQRPKVKPPYQVLLMTCSNLLELGGESATFIPRPSCWPARFPLLLALRAPSSIDRIACLVGMSLEGMMGNVPHGSCTLAHTAVIAKNCPVHQSVWPVPWTVRVHLVDHLPPSPRGSSSLLFPSLVLLLNVALLFETFKYLGEFCTCFSVIRTRCSWVAGMHSYKSPLTLCSPVIALHDGC